VIVVAHNMERELPRTLQSLSATRQLGIDADDYEVIVVDNGSTVPVDPAAVSAVGATWRVERIAPAPPSPAHAANVGVGLARGELVGLIVDGARISSPGLLAGARRARALAARPVITAPAFHLGGTTHMLAAEAGYDQVVEDELLAGSGWEGDAYELFRVSTLAGSSGRGLFGPMGESSSLFMPAALWTELGGLEERFALPAGGLANHDLYRRACALEGTDLIVLLGEATFHQYHGGAATSRRYTWDEMHADYQSIRGEEYRPPQNQPLYVGELRPPVLAHVERSARQAQDRIANEARRREGRN
jgi:hypothetical protein